MCVCACACACVRACVCMRACLRACVLACVHACVLVCVLYSVHFSFSWFTVWMWPVVEYLLLNPACSRGWFSSSIFSSRLRHCLMKIRRTLQLGQNTLTTLRVYTVFSFFVLKFANEKRIPFSFSNFKTKNGIPFSFLNIKTKNEFVFRFQISKRKRIPFSLSKEKYEKRIRVYVFHFCI